MFFHNVGEIVNHINIVSMELGGTWKIPVLVHGYMRKRQGINRKVYLLDRFIHIHPYFGTTISLSYRPQVH